MVVCPPATLRGAGDRSPPDQRHLEGHALQVAGIGSFVAKSDSKQSGKKVREATKPPSESPRALGTPAGPSSARDRYIIEPEGRPDRRVERAIALALGIAGGDGFGVTLLAPTASPLVISTLQQLLPLEQRMALVVRGSAELVGVPLRLETSRSIDGRCDRVVVIVWADEDLLEPVEAGSGRGAIIAVPRWPGDCEAWRRRWSPMGIVADGG